MCGDGRWGLAVLAYLDLAIVTFVLLAGFGLGAMYGWSRRGREPSPDGGGGARLYALGHYRNEVRSAEPAPSPPQLAEAGGHVSGASRRSLR